jgi:hypothetical protein
MAMKVKVFPRINPDELEAKISEWLNGKDDITIKYITQSQVQHGQSMSMGVTICIWYT